MSDPPSSTIRFGAWVLSHRVLRFLALWTTFRRVPKARGDGRTLTNPPLPAATRTPVTARTRRRPDAAMRRTAAAVRTGTPRNRTPVRAGGMGGATTSRRGARAARFSRSQRAVELRARAITTAVATRNPTAVTVSNNTTGPTPGAGRGCSGSRSSLRHDNNPADRTKQQADRRFGCLNCYEVLSPAAPSLGYGGRGALGGQPRCWDRRRLGQHLGGDRRAPRRRGAPRGHCPPRAVPILAIGHLLTTAKAVPHMVRGRETGGPDSLQEALKSCWRWHLARTGIDAMTFAANLRLLMSVWQPEEYSEEVREAAIRPSRPLV